jgi:hypothetical protein
MKGEEADHHGSWKDGKLVPSGGLDPAFRLLAKLTLELRLFPVVTSERQDTSRRKQNHEKQTNGIKV